MAVVFHLKAFTIRYNCEHITEEFNFSIVIQLPSLINMQNSNKIALYTLDFVDYILKRYNFQFANVSLAFENAKRAQLHRPDLAAWFAANNEVNNIRYSLFVTYETIFLYVCSLKHH